MRKLTHKIVKEVEKGLHKKYDFELKEMGFKFDLFNNEEDGLEFFVEIYDLKGNNVKNKDYVRACNFLPSKFFYRDFLFYLNKDE